MCVWRAWWVCVALAALAALAAARDRPRRADMSPLPFVMGSRYGRSPERVMSPRNDRFFMGSRYGKRAEEVPPDSTAQWESEGGEGGAGGARAAELTCAYTGVEELYRCRPRRPDYSRRSEDPSQSDD